MFNPDKKYIHSEGVDLPIMYCYLAGRIAGNCIDKCLEWRNKIVSYYKNYNGKGIYPISFLDALNSKESDSIDKLGLTSAIPPNLIYDKDILSLEKADVIVANMDDFFEEGIENLLEVVGEDRCNKEMIYGKILDVYDDYAEVDFKKAFYSLQDKILNRRENLGTIFETSVAMYLGKPVVLIVPERRKEIFEKHPFMKRASIIVTSTEELLKKKWLNVLYKSISGATYE